MAREGSEEGGADGFLGLVREGEEVGGEGGEFLEEVWVREGERGGGGEWGGEAVEEDAAGGDLEGLEGGEKAVGFEVAEGFGDGNDPASSAAGILKESAACGQVSVHFLEEMIGCVGGIVSAEGAAEGAMFLLEKFEGTEEAFEEIHEAEEVKGVSARGHVYHDAIGFVITENPLDFKDAHEFVKTSPAEIPDGAEVSSLDKAAAFDEEFQNRAVFGFKIFQKGGGVERSHPQIWHVRQRSRRVVDREVQYIAQGVSRVGGEEEDALVGVSLSEVKGDCTGDGRFSNAAFAAEEQEFERVGGIDQVEHSLRRVEIWITLLAVFPMVYTFAQRPIFRFRFSNSSSVSHLRNAFSRGSALF